MSICNDLRDRSGLLKSVRRRNFANRAGHKHEDAHFVLDAMNAIRLHDDIHLIHAAGRQEKVVEEDLDVVHAGLQLKVVLAPGPQVHLAVDHDSGSARVKKE